ncbi:hypothetical protein BT96DRAFT_1008907 [Gymnopus androsaceus JB14]|uniref:Uncharacterized protein n=1 Tax=Gymnopus androsaceus JB14 TaxID=1447944 RepID=A0A6A4GE11_9AGAR|nr:hypothetical protein BT96DRAFT_1008907 [Gymnopus androsaceus JB14]
MRHKSESFERICDWFSSGNNISSLQSISEESLLFTTVLNGPWIVLNRSSKSTSSGSLSSGCSSLIAAAAENVGLAPRNKVIHDADVTLVESRSKGSNRALAGQENDKTMAVIEVEGLVGKDSEENLKVASAPVDDGPSPLKKSRLPIFRIPSCLLQMSRMMGSSSKKSLSSFWSRSSSNTISTMASRDNNRPRSVKHLLEDLDSQISKLVMGSPSEAQISQLELQKDAKLVEISACKNILSPVHRVPVEIPGEILKLACHPKDKIIDLTCRLSGVCVARRKAAHAAPRLWFILCIDPVKHQKFLCKEVGRIERVGRSSGSSFGCISGQLISGRFDSQHQARSPGNPRVRSAVQQQTSIIAFNGASVP